MLSSLAFGGTSRAKGRLTPAPSATYSPPGDLVLPPALENISMQRILQSITPALTSKRLLSDCHWMLPPEYFLLSSIYVDMSKAKPSSPIFSSRLFLPSYSSTCASTFYLGAILASSLSVISAHHQQVMLTNPKNTPNATTFHCLHSHLGHHHFLPVLIPPQTILHPSTWSFQNIRSRHYPA